MHLYRLPREQQQPIKPILRSRKRREGRGRREISSRVCLGGAFQEFSRKETWPIIKDLAGKAWVHVGCCLFYAADTCGI